MSEPIMQIKAGETIIPIKTNIGRNEPINDVRRDIIDVVTTEPLTPTQIDAMKTNDWEMVWDNVTQGMQTGYTEIVEYHTWFARPLGDAEQVQVLQQQKQELIQQKSDLLVAKAEVEEERNVLAVVKEELDTNIKTMRKEASSFFRGRNDDVLIELLSLMQEWSLMDEANEGQPSVFEQGDVRKRLGHPYTCIQGHSTDLDMNRAPEKVPALWAVYHAKSARFALPWVTPTHAEDIYRAGEFMVWTDNTTYECLVNTDRAPDVLPNSWRKVDAQGNPIDEGGGGNEPEEPGETNSNGTAVWSEWQPWTSGLNSDLYQIGDRVTENGVRYIATLDDNHWSPASGTGWVVAPE